MINKNNIKKTNLINSFASWLGVNPFDILLILIGNATMSFSLVNIHSQSGITEGGILGAAVLLDKAFGWNQAITSFIMNCGFFILGVAILRQGFFKRAIFSAACYSIFYEIFQVMGPVLPSMEAYPILAAIVGGLLLGSGCGLVVTRGAVAGGDDCYAMIVSHYTSLRLSQSYFSSDFIVLLISFLVYLPFTNVLCSLLTTSVSSFVIGQFELRLPKPEFEKADGRESLA